MPFLSAGPRRHIIISRSLGGSETRRLRNNSIEKADSTAAAWISIPCAERKSRTRRKSWPDFWIPS